jgi:GNAT superfamily N-acetyltransferase
MGFTIETRLVKGRIMYIADLVVDEAVRSRGIGKLLLAYAHHLAVNENCRTIYLDSGTHRLEAHNFYFREGFRITAFNFACDLPS